MPAPKDSHTSEPRPSSPKTTYVTWEEFDALKRKVDDLRKEVDALKERLASA